MLALKLIEGFCLDFDWFCFHQQQAYLFHGIFSLIQDESDWNTFSLAFNLKDPNILEFQSKFLLKTPSKSKKWAQEESDLLSKIVK